MIKGTITFKGGSGSGNFGHSGRPGKIGGSAGGGGGGSGLQAPSAEAFLKDGNPGRGGDTKLPTGWKRTAVDEARTFVMTGDDVGVQIEVGYNNGYSARLNAYKVTGAGGMSQSAKMASLLPPKQTKRLRGGSLVDWEELQSEIDKVVAEAK